MKNEEIPAQQLTKNPNPPDKQNPPDEEPGELQLYERWRQLRKKP